MTEALLGIAQTKLGIAKTLFGFAEAEPAMVQLQRQIHLLEHVNKYMLHSSLNNQLM